MEERHDYYPIIQLCDNMISTDRDGISILDYLGPTFFGMTRHVPQMRDFVRQGCDFVVSEYKRFQADNDREMAWRYQMLMEYYSDRVGIWE
jgi:hypothetical protein